MQQVPGIIKDREAIGEKLRQVREAQGLTQDALAMRLGTDRKVISKHESGQQDMKMSSFIDYLEVLDVTPDQLLPEHTYMKKEVLKIDRLITIAKNLTERDIDILLAAAEQMKNP